MLRSLVELVAGLPPTLLVALAAGLAFGETAILLDLVVPGEAGMVVVGAAGAAAGVPVWLLAGAASIGSAAGDTVSFFLGRRLGGSATRRWSTRPRMAAALARARAHFQRHGGATVFLGRWIGALRAVVPFVAGGAGMSVRTFLAWNAAASIAWASTMVLLGHTFGLAIADALDRVDRWLSIAVLGVVVVVLVARRRRPHALRAS